LFCRSNPVAPDPRVEKEARTLARAGYVVQIIGWDRTGELEQHDQLPTPGRAIALHRLPIRANYGHGLGNLPQLLRWQAGLLGWLWRQRQRYDILHACDFDTILPALLVGWLARKPVVYDIFDFYADHLRATPTVLKGLIRRMDLWAINRAAAVILVDEARRVQIAGSRPKHLAIIYNSPEDAPAGPDQPGSPPLKLHLAYIGLLQVERGLVEMLTLLGRHPEWRLDMAGFGGDAERLQAAAQGLANVAWHGRVPYDQALALSQAADVLFATYDPAIPNHRYSSANKVFEAMLLGKPIIVARHTNMDRMIEAADCGLVVDYGDEAQLEAALQRLAADPALRARLGRNARQAYEREYSWAIMEGRLLDLYQGLK
jgi:glycosyltransferase involved in cell wall biosynthesis